MPGKTIGELNVAGPLTGSSFMEVENDDGESVKISLAALAAFIKAEESIVPSNIPYRGARVRLSASLNPGGGFHIVAWSAEDRDTDNLWSLAQPSRFVIPAGITKIKLLTYIRSAAGAAGRYAFFKKNGAYFVGGGGIGAAGTTYDLSLSSDVVDCVAGDYFELELYGTTSEVTGGVGSPTGLASWFALEVVEASA